MRKLLSALTSLLPVITLVACDASPASELAAPEIQADRSASSTGSSGAMVIRFQNVEFMIHLDAGRGLMSVHAPSDLCLGGSLGTLEVQRVTTPSQIEQVVFQTKGSDLPVAVYEATSFADAGVSGSFGTANFFDVITGDVARFCAFLQSRALLAEGTVRRVSNASNASFAVTWTGTLDRINGGQATLTEVYQLKADAQDPNDTSRWVVHVSKILLR